MDVSLGSLTVITFAAFLESLRQGHISAIPLLVVVCVLSYYIVFGRRGTTLLDRAKPRRPMPKLELIPKEVENVEKTMIEGEDEFAQVALPTSDIYFVLPASNTTTATETMTATNGNPAKNEGQNKKENS
jgi:hypothetical protein